MMKGKTDPTYLRLRKELLETTGLSSSIRRIVKEKSEEFPNIFPELKRYKNKLLVARVNEMVEWLTAIGATKEQRMPDIGKKVVYFWNPPGILQNSRYLRWELRDWAYFHDRPGDHKDFLFGYIHMNIPDEKVKHLNDISGSIVYYPVGRELSAGCHVRAAFVATLSIVKMYVTDHITLVEAINMYDRLVGKLVNEEVRNGLGVTNRGFSRTPLADTYEKYLLAESNELQIGGNYIGDNDIMNSTSNSLNQGGVMEFGTGNITFNGMRGFSPFTKTTHKLKIGNLTTTKTRSALSKQQKTISQNSQKNISRNVLAKTLYMSNPKKSNPKKSNLNKSSNNATFVSARPRRVKKVSFNENVAFSDDFSDGTFVTVKVTTN